MRQRLAAADDAETRAPLQRVALHRLHVPVQTGLERAEQPQAIVILFAEDRGLRARLQSTVLVLLEHDDELSIARSRLNDRFVDTTKTSSFSASCMRKNANDSGMRKFRYICGVLVSL